LLRFHVELGGEDLPQLGVQDGNGAGFGAGQFLLQRDGVFKFSDLLQDPDDDRDHARIADQLDETHLNSGAAEELVEFMEQDLPAD
jgi:hypothetical protein